MAPSYNYWRASLAGAQPELPSIDEPQYGFYRHVKGAAVAFFPHQTMAIPSADQPIVCAIYEQGQGGIVSHQRALEVWPWCAAQPVTEAVWRTAADGEDWPHEAAGLGHNRPPPDAFETTLARAERVMALAQNWLDENPVVETGMQGDQAAHYLATLRAIKSQLASDITNARRPYSGWADQVAAPMKEIVGQVEADLQRLKSTLEPFMVAHKRDRVGQTGSAVVRKARDYASIVNAEAAATFYATDPKVLDVVTNLATRDIRAGHEIPGTVKIEKWSIE